MVRLGISGLLLLLSLGACSEIQVPVGDSDGGLDGDATAGPDAMVSDCAIGAICDVVANYAFVTSTLQAPGDLGGLGGADALCKMRAAAAGLPDTGYVAWLSNTNTNARDRLLNGSGWIRTDKRPFALSKEDLLAGNIVYPLHLDEFGNAISTLPDVVTGTDVMGVQTTDGDCDDWTKKDVGLSASAGIAVSASIDWTIGPATIPCSRETRIYCLGTGVTRTLTIPEVDGRVAWISSGKAQGNAGQAALHGLCEDDVLAEPGRLNGVAQALIAIQGTTAAELFDLSQATWVRPDGVVLWEKVEDMATSSPLAPIRLRLDGAPTTSMQVWTGAANQSMMPGLNDNCGNWQLTNSKANIGQPSSVGNLFFKLPQKQDCDTTLPVYCLED